MYFLDTYIEKASSDAGFTVSIFVAKLKSCSKFDNKALTQWGFRPPPSVCAANDRKEKRNVSKIFGKNGNNGNRRFHGGFGQPRPCSGEAGHVFAVC